jgi:hypothetical protein
MPTFVSVQAFDFEDESGAAELGESMLEEELLGWLSR